MSIALAHIQHNQRCYFFPTLSYVALTCGNPKCENVHGIAFELSWFFWTLGLAFQPD